MENNNVEIADAKKTGTISAYWDKFKTEALNFLDRRKHSKKENIQLAAIVAGIIFIVGIFFPLLQAKISFSMIESTDGKVTSETVIFEPQNDVIKFSSAYFIFHQPLREFAIFGTELGDMQIMGLNLYDTLTTPMPDYSGITSAKDTLQSGALSILVDEKFVGFCNEYLGDFGDTVVEIGEVVYKLGDSLGDALGKIEQALDKVKAASDGIRVIIQSAEDALNTADTVIDIVFIIIIVLMLLVIFRNNKLYVVPGILSFFSVIFVAIGIAVLIINSAIRDAIAAGMASLSVTIADLLDSLLPGLSDMLMKLTSAETLSFLFKGTLHCGLGWWLSTIGIVAITVLSYMLVSMQRKTIKAALPETAPVIDAE